MIDDAPHYFALTCICGAAIFGEEARAEICLPQRGVGRRLPSWHGLARGYNNRGSSRAPPVAVRIVCFCIVVVACSFSTIGILSVYAITAIDYNSFQKERDAFACQRPDELHAIADLAHRFVHGEHAEQIKYQHDRRSAIDGSSVTIGISEGECIAESAYTESKQVVGRVHPLSQLHNARVFRLHRHAPAVGRRWRPQPADSLQLVRTQS